MKVAVLGVGLMGSAVAEGMVNCGHEVIVYNRTVSRTEPLVEKGATAASTAAEAISTANQCGMPAKIFEDMKELFVKATEKGYGSKDATSIAEIMLGNE